MSYALSPIERRSEYYNNIKLGNDLNQQTKMISEASKSMISAQMKSANSIVSSQERIHEGIDALSYKINDVNEGLSGLKAAFEFGISEVVWQIEQNRKVLKNILEVLLAPLDTQAKELRKRAEEAYSNGWIDEALVDFLESEKKNKYDFSVHISIGIIYLFSKKDNEKALEYFEKATKYSKPKSNYHASFALLHAALIKYKFKLIEEAALLSDEACKFTPNLAEALYQNAFYHALLSKPDISIPCLKKAIKLDINYCEKILSENSFKRIEKDIIKMFKDLRNYEKSKALEKYEKIKEMKDLVLEYRKQAKEFVSDIEISLNKETAIFYNQSVRLIKRNSYRDLVDANKHLVTLKEMLIKELRTVHWIFDSERRKYAEKIDSFKPKLIDTAGVKDFMNALGFSSLLPSISFFIGAASELGLGSGIMMAIVCAIPLIGHIYLIYGLISLFFLSGSSGDSQIVSNSALACIFLTPLYLWAVKFIPKSINKMREDEFEKNVYELKHEREKYKKQSEEIYQICVNYEN